MTNQRYIYAASTSSAVPFPSTSQRHSTVFSINGSNINHANLRRHLHPDEQQPVQDPPPLVRQGAFMFDDYADPVCRICYGVTEDQENGRFIRPCQCRGSMYVNTHHHLQPLSSSSPPPPPIPSTSSSSSISHRHHSLLPPSPHQEFHDIPKDNNNNNNNNNNLFLNNNNNDNDSGNVHDKCLNTWLTTGNPTTRRCSTCLHEYTFPPASTLQPDNHPHQHTHHRNDLTTPGSSSPSPRPLPPPTLFALPVLSSSSTSPKSHLGITGHFPGVRFALYAIGIIFLLSLGVQTVCCTEIRKVPGTEIDDNSEAPLGRPDYIWLPIVNRECWRSSYFGQIYYMLVRPYSIVYIILCISIFYLVKSRFHHMPSTTR